MSEYPALPDPIYQILREGIVIPAHPLALDSQRKFNPRRQRALSRYYLDAGAGGLAVGVHSTQFDIREKKYALFEPVLSLAADTISEWETVNQKTIVRIAGICGKTQQAVAEAQLARRLGYHAGLISMGAMKDCSLEEMIQHAHRVAQEIPLFGFYLQPAAGGVILPYEFWRSLADIPNLVGIKVAPFNRYQTLDVIRAVAESGRADEIILYTGNDDHILLDLLTDYVIPVNEKSVRLHFQGGLLGHWACWTKKVVEMFELCKQARQSPAIPASLLALANQVTDCNAAFFDASNHYAGALCGVNEVLRRQGLVETTDCLNDCERLSPGQLEQIDRVYRTYPELNDDDFVKANLNRWMEDIYVRACA